MAEVLHGLLQELPGIRFRNVHETMVKAVVALGNQHTQEVVEVTLSLSHPSERWVLPLPTPQVATLQPQLPHGGSQLSSHQGPALWARPGQGLQIPGLRGPRRASVAPGRGFSSEGPSGSESP